MDRIIDYKCTYDFASGVNEAFTKDLGLTFPEAYCNRADMVTLAKAQRAYQRFDFCNLPFCHTLESEAMGADINLGNEQAGPRARNYLLQDPSEILNLAPIDFSKGRIHETILAAQELIAQGEAVVFDVTGPLTALDAIIDPRYLFKTMRKNPELTKEILWKMGEESLRFMQVLYDHGVRIISYADSSGGVNILGPAMMEQIMRDFMVDFLKKLHETLPKEMLILLCPKITLALLGTENAVFEDIALDEDMSYGQAILALQGKTRFLGHTCIKNANQMLDGGRIRRIALNGANEAE